MKVERPRNRRNDRRNSDARMAAPAHSDIASATASQPIDCGHYDICFARDGTWSHRGSPIARMPLVRLFSTVLRRDEEGHRCTVTYVRKWHISEERTASS